MSRPAGDSAAPETTVLDERGRRCPMPVIALARTAGSLPAGSVIVVISDDPGSLVDIPAWCRLTGRILEHVDPHPDGGSVFTVRTAGVPPATSGQGQTASAHPDGSHAG